MEFNELAAKRYSCKKYSSRGIEDKVMEKILEAGRLAPTAKNLQEQHVYVLRSAEALAKVDETTPCRYGAPVVLAVAYDKDNVYTYPDGKRKISLFIRLLQCSLLIGQNGIHRNKELKDMQTNF